MTITKALSILLLGAVTASAQGPFRVNVMPGFPNSPQLQPEQTHMLRPGQAVVWGNINGGFGPVPVAATYAWSFSANQNLLITDDGDLSGAVTSVKEIFEIVTFALLNNATREVVTATLTVDAGPLGIDAQSVVIEIIDASDPGLDEVEQLQVSSNIAIASGLRSLYLRAVPSTATNGDPLVSWVHGGTGNNTRAATAFALWAFQNQGHLPRSGNFEDDIYAEFVHRGLEWLFNQAIVQATSASLVAPRATMLLGATADQVSDLNANGQAILIDNSSDRGYANPIVMAAIVASASPDRIVEQGAATGLTYKTVVEDMIDWAGANQNQGGTTTWSGRGGWNYTPSSGTTRSDMSINSWFYVAMEGAMDVFLIDVPDWMKQEIEYTLVAHQVADGRFGYVGTSTQINAGRMATTGGGLSGLALVESASLYPAGQIIATTGATGLDTIPLKRNAALSWLGTTWNSGTNASSQDYGRGNRGNLYVMWTVSRALRLTARSIGLPSGQNILLSLGGQRFDWENGQLFDSNGLPTGVVAPPNDPLEGYASWLVRNRTVTTATIAHPDYGSWNGWFARDMTTALAVLVLTPRVFVQNCPTIVNIPVVSLSPSGASTLPTGGTMLLSGRAVSQGPTRPILGVTVNGIPVNTLDSSGNFFVSVPVQAGPNTFVIRAVDRCGFSDVLHTVEGDSPTLAFNNLSNVSLSATVQYTNTSYNQSTRQLIVTATAQNVGNEALDAPLLMVIDNFSHPTITLDNPHGFTPGGKPYVAFTDPSIQSVLMSGATSAPRVLVFNNPLGLPVAFTVSWLAPANQPPAFVTAPIVDGEVLTPYSYGALATDANNDPITYALLLGPAGMSISATGQVQWAPTAADVGTHEVRLRASDGRGGFAVQDYVLTVQMDLLNRVPQFTSVPPIQSAVGATYQYLATASDPDNDPLTFSLLVGPPNLTISSIGEVLWPFVVAGLTPVTIRVDDTQGGYAEQSFTIAAGVQAGGATPPTYLSTPQGIAVVGQPYSYLPVLTTGATAGPIAYSLITGPNGMAIHPTTGLLTWLPGTSQVGVHAVEVRATVGTSYSTQGFVIQVLLTPPNAAPIFQSTPPFLATINLPFQYAAVAVDPEGTAVTYGLPTGPVGMTIDPLSGVVSWLPLSLSFEAVSVTATDAEGRVASQSFNLSVLPTNNPPTITSSPSLSASVGATYLYQVVVTDPDPDTPTFSLSQFPGGMSINSTNGLITWTPPLMALGQHPVTVLVDDGRGGTDTQSFRLFVIQDTQSPQLVITASHDPGVVGAPLTICVQATDNVGVTTRTLSIDGIPMTLDVFGCATVVPTAPGMLVLAATAGDASGNVGTTTRSLNVDFQAPGAPVLQIQSPAPGEVVTCPTSVVATIEDPTGTLPAPAIQWTLKVVNERTGNEKILATGTQYVTSGVIGLLDPTLLSNDGYRLVLTASNAGFSASQPSPISIAGNYKIGHFRYDTLDLAVPVAGLPISISRRYNSLDTSIGDFGAGWSLGFNVQVSDVIKETPGQVEGLRSGSRVYVNRHDGLRVGFTTEVKPSSPWFPWIVSVSFKADSSHDGDLELTGGGLYFREPQTGVVYTDFYLTPLNPDLYTYTADRGVKFYLSESLGLQAVTDLAGNTLTVTPTGIASSSGLSVVFERDGAGRITRVVHPVDPNATTPPPDIHYEYDAVGNLVRVLNEVNEETLYFYENPNFPHYLTRVEDALGRPLVRNVYDNDGRLVAQCGPGGDPLTLAGCTVFATDINLGITTIFDARGNRIDLFIDDFGNVIKERRWTSVSDFVDYNFTYDTDGNMLTEERAPGETWVFTYDERGNKLSEADPQGRTWLYTYNSCDQLLTSCDPLGHCTVFTHDAQCNLIAIQDPMGRLTTIGYNPLGQPVSFTPPVGGSWSMGYDPRGFPASMTDPQGRTEFTMYGNTGLLLSRTDRRGRQVSYIWDSAGKLLREQWDNGLIYDYTRNAVGEILSVTGPHVNLNYAYDNAGRIETATAAGSAYPSITLAYSHDSNDNVTQVTDSLGGATAYAYNALNHLNQILFSIGSDSSIDAAPSVGSTGCRVDITTDQTGLMRAIERYDDLAGSSGAVRTILDYDCTGCARRLNRIRHEDFVSTATINDIQIVRDASNRITEVSDADGVHSYALDGVGRVLSATHTGANPLPSEHYGYDAGGNRTSSHLTGTHQYSYSTQGVGEELRATSEYSYAYDANGALEQRTHLLSGEVWDYSYDHRNRLTSITHQSGQAVVLNSLTRIYDPADRLATEVINGLAYHYYYDNENPVLILDDQGQVVRRRLYTRYTDQVLAEADSAGHRWLLTDQVGSVKDVIAAGGAPLTHYRYDTFGRRLGGSLPNDRATLTFNGLEFNSVDGSGHYRARSYMPELGRFAQMDPKFPFGYSFVGSAPLTHSDPSGKTAILEYACVAASAVFAACTIYSWLSPIGDIFRAVGEFLGDINSAPPDGQALVQAFLESTYYFLVGGLPFSNGPTILFPTCGQSAALTVAGAGANAAIGNPSPLPCQGSLY